MSVCPTVCQSSNVKGDVGALIDINSDQIPRDSGRYETVDGGLHVWVK